MADISALRVVWQQLQFGHGCGAVEICRSGSGCRLATARFNSATAAEPWRFTHDAKPCARGMRFNSATAAEPWRWPPASPPNDPSDRRFNSATAAEPWRWVTVPTVPLPVNGCFNSATAAEPWRYGFRARKILRDIGLQFGHGCGAVEIRCGRRGDIWQPGCFNSATAAEPWR